MEVPLDRAMVAVMDPGFNPDRTFPRWLLYLPLCLVTGASAYRLYKQWHLVTDFIKLDHEAVVMMGELATKEYATPYLQTKRIAHRDSPNVKRIDRVLGKLISANPELTTCLSSDKARWRFNLLNEPVCRSLAFPNGYIFIHQGLLDTASSDDELSFVLAHELAVVYLRQTENYLNDRIWKWKLLGFILQPIAWQLFTEPVLQYIATKFLTWSPKQMIKVQETLCGYPWLLVAADVKAFEYIAKACFDHRAVAAILMKYYLQEKMDTFWQARGKKGQVSRNLIQDHAIRTLSIAIPDWRKQKYWNGKERWDMISDLHKQMEAMRKKSCLMDVPSTDPRKEPHAWAKQMDKFMFDIPNIRHSLHVLDQIASPVRVKDQNQKDDVRSVRTDSSGKSGKAKSGFKPPVFGGKDKTKPPSVDHTVPLQPGQSKVEVKAEAAEDDDKFDGGGFAPKELTKEEGKLKRASAATMFKGASYLY